MSLSLQSLLESYAFLEAALRDDDRMLSGALRQEVERKRDSIFLKITRFESDDARVTRAQVEFMISTLASLARDSEVGSLVRDACLMHIGQIMRRIDPPRSDPNGSWLGRGSETNGDYRLLDSLSERVAVIGSDYRYLYTNRSNAQLHHARPADLVGAELCRIVGDRAFSNLTKPCVDACLAGQSMSFAAPQTIDGDERIFLISADPFRAADAGASAAIITMRDLASLALPAEKIVRSLL